MTMIRTIGVYLWAGLIMVGGLPYLAYNNHLKKKIGEVPALERLDKLVRWFAGVLIKISGASVEVVGAENVPAEGAVVFVGNHQSNFDIPVVVTHIKRAKGFVVKEELGKMPIFDVWIRGMRCPFIARGEGRKALEAILQATKMVKAGYPMVIFPEGTRSIDGTLGEFKAGALKIATKAGVPVVPFAIDGARDVMPKGQRLFYAKAVKLTILPPISAEEIKELDSKTLAQQVKTAIAQCLGQEIAPETAGEAPDQAEKLPEN